MDFGVLGFVSSDIGNGAPSLSLSQHQTFLSSESKPKLIGSGFTKQERSLDSDEEDKWKSCKFPKTNDLSTPRTNANPLHQATPLLRSDSLVSTDQANYQDHMISFLNKSTQNDHHSYYQHPSFMYTRNAGYGFGAMNASMHGVFTTGVKGHFTPSQMMELQHQALIYKYITCNKPVPSNLLIPLKKSVYPCGFTTSQARLLAYKSLGWGPFHMRYTGNTDPEPGRCRRTDGKKWRCSRDVVADQKYCERHLNRGRHRSRKPEEGQTTGTTNSKVVPMSSSMPASVNTIGGVANSLAIARQHQFKNLQSGAVNPSLDTVLNRMHIDERGLSVVLASTTNLKSNNSTFTLTKEGVAFGESPLPDFGHVASGSLVNPSRRSYYMNSKEHVQETQDELKPDWTQLSMSYPMATSEFSSSSSLLAKEEPDLSSLRLCREFDRIQMGLGVNNDISDQNKKQANWIPVTWPGSSTGGPLGEVLNNTANNVDSCKECNGNTEL